MKNNFDIEILRKEIKHHLNDNGKMSEKTMSVEKNEILHKDKIVAEIMRNCFVEVTKTVIIKSLKKLNSDDMKELIYQFHNIVSINKKSKKGIHK